MRHFTTFALFFLVGLVMAVPAFAASAASPEPPPVRINNLFPAQNARVVYEDESEPMFVRRIRQTFETAIESQGFVIRDSGIGVPLGRNWSVNMNADQNKIFSIDWHN